MPRKGPAPKRPIVVDPVYGSPLVTQLVNKVLLDGKKSTAEKIVYGALEGCREKTGTDPVVTLKRALDNVKPTLEVRSRRVGGATYQVPVEVTSGPQHHARAALAHQLLSRQRREKTMTERLMNEMLDASNGLGASVKRARTRTRWPSPTRPSRTTAGNRRTAPRTTRHYFGFGAHRVDRHRPRPRQGPQHRDHGAHRRGQDHDHRADPVLHRHQLQDR